MATTTTLLSTLFSFSNPYPKLTTPISKTLLLTSHSSYSTSSLHLSAIAATSRRWRRLPASNPVISAPEPEVGPSEVAEEEEAVGPTSVAVAPPPPPVEAQLAEAEAGAAEKEDVYAVVMIGGRQYIVIPGRYMYTQRLKGANVNDQIILNKVLLVASRTKIYIGFPVVTNAAVHAVVEEVGRDPKKIIFKFKRKKKYRRTMGHRQPNTRIRITGISGYEDYPADPIK